MFCANCYKEIPAGKSYYKHQDTNQSYCSLECFNDHMIYTHTITLETSEGEQSDDDTDSNSTVGDTAVKHSSFPRNNMSEGALNE